MLPALFWVLLLWVVLFLVRPLNWGTIYIGLVFTLFYLGVRLGRPWAAVVGGIGVVAFLAWGV
ncbi:hypothetical protein [Streptomyces sp. KL116D]|uniref:hypothetical protein n=1 Tax=Streptomyces sp. KL116D TaxID=3045152 RepID=UPI00355905AB